MGGGAGRRIRRKGAPDTDFFSMEGANAYSWPYPCGPYGHGCNVYDLVVKTIDLKGSEFHQPHS